MNQTLRLNEEWQIWLFIKEWELWYLETTQNSTKIRHYYNIAGIINKFFFFNFAYFLMLSETHLNIAKAIGNNLNLTCKVLVQVPAVYLILYVPLDWAKAIDTRKCKIHIISKYKLLEVGEITEFLSVWSEKSLIWYLVCQNWRTIETYVCVKHNGVRGIRYWHVCKPLSRHLVLSYRYYFFSLDFH